MDLGIALQHGPGRVDLHFDRVAIFLHITIIINCRFSRLKFSTRSDEIKSWPRNATLRVYGFSCREETKKYRRRVRKLMQTLATIIFGEIAVSPEHDSIHDSRFRYKAKVKRACVLSFLPRFAITFYATRSRIENIREKYGRVSITCNIFNDKNKIAPCSTIVESPNRRTKS